MPVEWSSDPDALSSERWLALLRADPEATFFHTPDYLQRYRETSGDATVEAAFVEHGDESVAAAAFELGDGTLTFLGGSEVTDYMGPVGPPSARKEAAKTLIGGLAARDDWRIADLRGLPEEGSWLDALSGAAAEADIATEVGSDGIAPAIDLPSTWEEYLGSLQGKLRHEIRRKDRRLREAFPDARLVDASAETLEDDLDRFVALHRSSEGEKARFLNPERELFFRRLATALLPKGIFRMVFLEAAGEKLAAAVGFWWQRGFLLYNSAYDRRHARIAPGMVLVSELIRDLIRSGCDRLDMLKGDLGYKYRFGAAPHGVGRLLLRR